MLAHVLDLDDVTFELKDQVIQANKDRWSAMRGKKKYDERATDKWHIKDLIGLQRILDDANKDYINDKIDTKNETWRPWTSAVVKNLLELECNAALDERRSLTKRIQKEIG